MLGCSCRFLVQMVDEPVLLQIELPGRPEGINDLPVLGRGISQAHEFCCWNWESCRWYLYVQVRALSEARPLLEARAPRDGLVV